MPTASWIQFRLSGLLWATCLGGVLCAWAEGQWRLSRHINGLEQLQRRAGIEARDRAKHWISRFAKQHGGTTVTHDVTWMWVDLQGRPIGDQELAEIVPELKTLDDWPQSTPRCLALFGSRVSEQFADQLRRELSSWTIVTSRKVALYEFEPRSS